MSEMKIGPPPSFEPGIKAPGAVVAPNAGEDAEQVDFAALIKRSLDAVNASQESARTLAERFELGDPNVDLVRVMVEMQKARVSFEAVAQVRNKFVEAYREIMNMQV